MSLKYRSIPTKTLAQNLSSSGTTLYLNNTLDWDDAQLSSADFGTQAFALLRNASNTQIELIEIDPTTVTSAAAITISKRGLGYDGTQTANTETKYNWSAFDTYVELGSDTPQMLQYLKDYIDGIAIAGVPDASLTAKGIVEIATQAEVDSGDDTGSTTAPTVVSPSTIRAKAYHDYAVDSVGTDSYAITITPAITAYAAGQVFTFKAGTANTGAATLNVSGLGAKTIKKFGTLDLVTGDIVADRVVTVVYDGTNMQLQSGTPSVLPVVNVYTANTPIGSSTTQFDITNTVATTYRYTYDGTGTDPSISAVTFPIGTVVDIQAQNFSSGNKGLFTVTASGANYIEVTNASGVVESNKTIGTGYIVKGAVYTKPTNLKYVTIEMVGAGGAGGTTAAANRTASSGGGSGGYINKLIAAGSISATENYVVGYKGTGVATAALAGLNGGRTVFQSLIAGGGGGGAGDETTGGTAGTVSGGDYNIAGQIGGLPDYTYTGSNTEYRHGGDGGDTILGLGGRGVTNGGAAKAGAGYGSGGSGACTNSASSITGADGGSGVIILTEYFN